MRLVGTAPRRRLSRELKELREQAGFTLETAAERLETSISRLSRIETAMQAPDVQWVKAMLDLYEHSQRWDELLALARLARQPGWWRAYGLRDRGYIPLEAAAAMVREFSLTTVPGLLQTAGYAAAVLASRAVPRSDADRQREVDIRLRRQRRLYAEDDPLHLEVVIDEAVLRRPIGGIEVLRDQLDHLLIATELDTVTLQILPVEVGGHPGLDGTFVVLSFPEPDEPDLVYVEHPGGSTHIENPEQLTRCRLAFDQLQSAALSPADSVKLLERLVNQL